ncbi:MAG: hypothetical protein ACM67R_06510 [Clostridiales bacterium]
MLTFSGLVMYNTIYTIAIFLVCNYLNSMIVLGFIGLLILFSLVLKFIEEISEGD